jgi:hypothetical protein
MSALVEQARRGLHPGQAATTTTSFDYALPYLDLEVPELAQAAGINAINTLHIFPPAFLRLELTSPGQQRALTLFAQVKALSADCAASAVLNYRGLNLAAAEFSIEVDCEAGPRLVVSTAILTEDFKAPTDALTDLSLMSSRNSCPFDANSALLMEPRERYIFINHVTLSQLPDDIGASFPLEAVCRSFFREYIAAFGTLRNWCSSVVLFDQEAEDLGLRLAREDNVFVPLIPLTNQFATRSSVFSIRLDMIVPPDSLKVVGSIVSAVTDRLGTDVHGKPIQGISPLLPTDLIPISYLRSQGGELFDPLTCFFYFKNLGLVDVNNLLKHRPNLSFKYILNGRHYGHIVAYEGQLEDTVGGNGKDRSSVVYLA